MIDARALSDEELVERIKSENVELFEVLVSRYQKKLVNYIFRMINDFQTAMELSQEVFLKVYTSLDKFNPEYKFTTWIHRIASNATIDWLRKKRIDTYSLENPANPDGMSLEQQLPSGDIDPAQELEMRQLKGRIEGAIAKLPFIYRQLIVLRHLNDLSYDEIAEAVNLPLGTVKNRIFRGREMLKVTLASELPQEKSNAGKG